MNLGLPAGAPESVMCPASHCLECRQDWHQRSGLGAWGGPLAYYSGQRLGALTFHPPLVFHLAVLGAAWAVAVPLLFFLAEKFQGRPAPPPGRIRSGTDYRSRPSSPY